MNYPIFDPLVMGPLDQVSKKDAKIHFNHFVKSIPERIEVLTKYVLENHNIDLNTNPIEKIDSIFPTLIYENTIDNQVSPETYSICNDVSMLLGSYLIDTTKGLEWKLYIWGKKNIAYHRSVIMGFDVPNKKYNIDFDFLLCQYSHRLVKGKEIEENLFVEMLDEIIPLTFQ